MTDIPNDPESKFLLAMINMLDVAKREGLTPVQVARVCDYVSERADSECYAYENARLAEQMEGQEEQVVRVVPATDEQIAGVVDALGQMFSGAPTPGCTCPRCEAKRKAQKPRFDA